LLRRLPLVVCPSFLREIQRFDTSFPAERISLRSRCDFLQSLPSAEFTERTNLLRHIHLSTEVEAIDWVKDPSSFISSLTAYLWSSGQIDTFRAASVSLFAHGPTIENDDSRLTIILAGAGVQKPGDNLFRKLRSRGLLLTGFDPTSMPGQIEEAFNDHSASTKEPYANWYIDGTIPFKLSLTPNTVKISYPQLEPIRLAILSYMDAFVQSKRGQAEDLRAGLSRITFRDIHADKVTNDPVLQRFYTDIFTEGSGTQIFSTTFVQWAARELARRAQPRTVLLRYGPRQRQKSLDDLIRQDGDKGIDAEGALRDAEMGAYYALLEMDRITARGKGIFFLWIEGTTAGILVARGAPAGVRSDTPINLKAAVRDFG
jgi:hypothetical protein